MTNIVYVIIQHCRILFGKVGKLLWAPINASYCQNLSKYKSNDLFFIGKRYSFYGLLLLPTSLLYDHSLKPFRQYRSQ